MQMAASSIPGRSKRYLIGEHPVIKPLHSTTRAWLGLPFPTQIFSHHEFHVYTLKKNPTCKTNTAREWWYYMKMGRGKNREKIRKIKHIYNIFYTGGSSAPFTNHDRSYRSRGSDDLRPAGLVKAPATAGGTQVVILSPRQRPWPPPTWLLILCHGRGIWEMVLGSAPERFD